MHKRRLKRKREREINEEKMVTCGVHEARGRKCFKKEGRINLSNAGDWSVKMRTGC